MVYCKPRSSFLEKTKEMRILLISLLLTGLSFGYDPIASDKLGHSFGSYTISHIIQKQLKTDDVATFVLTLGIGIGWEYLQHEYNHNVQPDIEDVYSDIIGALGYRIVMTVEF